MLRISLSRYFIIDTINVIYAIHMQKLLLSSDLLCVEGKLTGNDLPVCPDSSEELLTTIGAAVVVGNNGSVADSADMSSATSL